MPNPRQIGEVLRRYFRLDPDPFFAVGGSVVIGVVAHAAGIPQSPQLGALVRAVMIQWGAVPSYMNNRRLWKNVRPAHLTRQDAARAVAKLRQLKRPPKQYDEEG